ncbi:hypothetical protein [Zymobacter sp. IVIA_5232.4 C2]|uniref:hypothetical protein n=1 Tax=Zymobacter sp. IVIA_5232.4 C2 TaxID=3394855 RepID=UPI0039C2393E
MTYEQFIYSLLGVLSPFFTPGVQADSLPTQPNVVVTPTSSASTSTATTTPTTSTTDNSSTSTGSSTSGTGTTTGSTTGSSTSGTGTTTGSTTGSSTSGTGTATTGSTTTTTTERPTVKTPRRRTALELSRQYYDTRSQCDDGSPAYMCTGVMLRSNKNYSDQYHVWDPSPFSTKTGGTSFSWLRSDTRYSHLAFGYNSGFIFFPQQKTDANAVKVDALCYFLLDASTASRDNHGCGAATVEFPDTSNTCDHYGIATAEKWLEHYQSEQNDRQHHQCGFDLTGDKATAAERFKVATAAHALLGDTGFNELNEFRLATWESGKGGQLPLQAFFYLADTDGLSDAQHYQLDYYNQTQAFLPVIRITMPQTQNAQVQFNYVPSDQALTPVY